MRKGLLSNKMAGKEARVCSSCFSTTKYTCLTCGEYFCTPCSVFENDEDVPGWKAGSSVAYCEVCFREKMEREMTKEAIEESSSSASNDQPNVAPQKKQREVKSNVTVTKRKRADEVEDDSGEELDEDEYVDIDGDDDKEEGNALAQIVKKGKGKAKQRAGRKPRWCPNVLDDFIDIIVSNSTYKTKLIFTNTKNQRNGPIYEKILKELKERASARGDKFSFQVAQMRTKFKKCVSQCKQAALTQKSATGIKRFQEDRGLGKWFNALYEVVKTRDSCQPDQALEPSSSEKSFDNDNENQEEGKLFVPVKTNRKKQTTKAKLDATTTEVINLVKETVKNDPTKELISFIREEMEKSRQHELKLLHMIQNQRVSPGYDSYYQQATYPAMPYGESTSSAAGYFPTWQGGFGHGPSNQSPMPGMSYGALSPTPVFLSNERDLTKL